MSTRAASWLAWSLAGLSLVMSAASAALDIATRSVQPPSNGGTGGDSGVLIFVLPFLAFSAFPIVGALIASKRPHNPIGWICLADGLLWMLIAITDSYSFYGFAMPGSVPFPMAIYALSAWLWVPAVGLVGTYLLLLFPNGRLPSRRWRPLGWLSGVVILVLSVATLLAPGPLEGLEGVRNPFGLEGHPWIGGATLVVNLLLPVCILASAVSLILRYRHSGGEQREQIKWIAFAASVVVVMFLIAMVVSFIFPSGAWGAANSPLWLDLLFSVVLLSFGGVPVAVGLAVLRYRLYDIDVVINRALVYATLTALLAATYFGGVTGAQAIFRTLTGQEQQPQLAVVASTLLIAALFTPLRRRIQSFIDRRFYRRKYDARKTLDDFSATLRDETDLDALNNDLVGVVRDTMQPAHVSLWLRPEASAKGAQAD